MFDLIRKSLTINLKIIDAGGSLENLGPFDESGCISKPRDKEPKSAFEHDLHAHSTSFPHPTEPNWMPHANLCTSCLDTNSTNNQVVCSCNVCGGTTFTAPCTFQRGVPR